MDRGAWRATVRGVAESRTRLSTVPSFLASFVHCREALSPRQQASAARFWLSHNYHLKDRKVGPRKNGRFHARSKERHRVNVEYLVMPEGKQLANINRLY